jgi:hypothetical protein
LPAEHFNAIVAYMGRICTICASPESAKINAELIRTKGATTTVARAFGVSEKAMERHMKNHVKRSLGSDSLDSGDGSGRLNASSKIRLEVRKVLARNYRLSIRAEQEGKLAAAVGAMREVAANLAFVARLEGLLDSDHASTTNILNLNVPESTLRKMAAMYLQNHPALPDAQPEPADSSNGVLTLSAGIVEGEGNG